MFNNNSSSDQKNVFFYIYLFSKFVKLNLGLGSATKLVKFEYNNVFIKKLGYDARFKYINIYNIFIHIHVQKYAYIDLKLDYISL